MLHALQDFRASSHASAAYNDARTALLAEERALLDHIVRVAEQRRRLPEGPVIEDVMLEFAAIALLVLVV